MTTTDTHAGRHAELAGRHLAAAVDRLGELAAPTLPTSSPTIFPTAGNQAGDELEAELDEAGE